MKRILLFFILFASFSLCVMGQESEDPDVKYAAELLKKGTQAPDFVIANGDTLVGKSLSSFRGRYVVLDFWATWCPDCRKDVPAMRELYKRYASKDVVFISVSFDKDKSVWQKYIRENDMPWIHHSELKPWKQTVISGDYRIKWIPSMYVLDKEGKVILGTVCVDKLDKVLNILTSLTPEMYGEYIVSVFNTRYAGGMDKFKKDINNNLQYPDMANALSAECTVLMNFTLNPDGSVTDISASECKIGHYNKAAMSKYTSEQQNDMLRECARSFAKDAFRVIKQTKRWNADSSAKPIKLFFVMNYSVL